MDWMATLTRIDMGFVWTLGVGDGQGAWLSAVHGVAKGRHDWLTALN